jgi:hypothetical protein
MKKYLLLILIPIAVLALLTSYAHTAGSNNALLTALKKVFPVIIVGNNTISILDWEENVEIGKKLDLSFFKRELAEQLVKDLKLQILTAELGVEITRSMIDDELNFYKKDKTTDYKEALDRYFNGSESLFVKYVVVPQVFEANLQMHYNADFKRHSRDYQRAKDILDKVTVENFGELAKELSDDKLSGQFGGDLGFFEEGEILPELEQEIRAKPLGEVSKDIIVSRHGYHIIYPVEIAETDGKKLWHAKHILIRTTGFDDWVEDETKDIKVKYLLKFEN